MSGFTSIDVDPEKTVISTIEVSASEHETGLLPLWLTERDVTLVIAVGVGTHARSLCSELSIGVIAGRPEVLNVLAQQYLIGTLDTVDHAKEPS